MGWFTKPDPRDVKDYDNAVSKMRALLRRNGGSWGDEYHNYRKLENKLNRLESKLPGRYHTGWWRG